ncbi:MAG TPA: hypothetical protein VD931_21810 [Baekduia sp.]|nr:hypothetical protein [Baekduia sp.]
MGAVAVRRQPDVDARAAIALAGLAAACGALIGMRPGAGAGVVVVGLAVAAIAARPVLATHLVLVGTLLLAGMDRGRLVPLLRPNEAVVVIAVAGLAAHLALCAARRTRPRLTFAPSGVDLTIVLLALLGSVAPLAWMISREEDIVRDDVLYALQLWKYLVIYVVVRLTVRTPREVLGCLWVALGTAAVVALLGIPQALGIPGAQDLILRIWSPQDDAGAFEPGRATSTLGSSFSVADVMLFSLAIAAALLVKGHPARGVLAGLVALFAMGTLAAGQFSGVIGLLVAAVAFGMITRRLGRTLAIGALLAVLGGIALQPVIQARIDKFDTPRGLPPSWTGRLDNLETHFWPELRRDRRWLTGVRPMARVKAPERWRDWIYIESGHTWLLWTGGVAFAAAFALFLLVAGRRVLRVARTRGDPVGAAATASFTALAVLAVLMTLDPHLTLRGSAELQFALLALALTAGGAATARGAPRRARPAAT